MTVEFPHDTISTILETTKRRLRLVRINVSCEDGRALTDLVICLFVLRPVQYDERALWKIKFMNLIQCVESSFVTQRQCSAR